MIHWSFGRDIPLAMIICMFNSFSLNMFLMSILEVIVDAAALSEQGVLTRCDIGANTVERSGIECLM